MDKNRSSNPISERKRLQREQQSEPERLQIDSLIRKRPLAKRLGVSPWTIDRWRRLGTFPPPIELSPTVLAWRLCDVEAWLRTRPGGVSVEPQRRKSVRVPLMTGGDDAER
jgi:predicted DNA-binding transcriptional regulator AlpA